MAEWLRHWTWDRQVAGSNPDSGSNSPPDRLLTKSQRGGSSVYSPWDETKQ